MWCEITERKLKKGKLYIRLEDDEGQEVKPKILRDISGYTYTAVYKPEHAPFFELRPQEEMGIFKDRLEVIEVMQ